MKIIPIRPPAFLVAVLLLTFAQVVGCAGAPLDSTSAPAENVVATSQPLSTCVTIQRGLASPWGTVADAPINSALPTQNYGANPAAAIGLVSGAQRQMLQLFNVASVPTTATVTSASLTLTAIAGSSSPAATMTAAPITASWVESTATWTSFGGAYGSALADTGASSGVASSTITITGTAPGLIATVQGWVTTPSSNKGLVLDCGAGRCNPATSEQTTASQRPKLDVCYTTAAPTCTDSTKNGAETDVDCGGGTCPTCATGKICSVGADCTTGTCTSGICAVPPPPPCTPPASVSVTPTTLTYRTGLAVDRYDPASPSGSWLVVWHGGGGTSTTASKLDANVVAVCGIAVAQGVTCYAVDYTPASSTTPVGIAFQDSLCAMRFAAADAASIGLNPARGGVAGISWGGTLASATAVMLRAGYTVPGGAGNMLPNGVDLSDPTCPTAPALGDDTLAKAGALWYPVLDWRSWNVVNTNGAAANANLVTNAGATSFTDPVYLPHATDLSAIVYPHSTAATGIAWALAQGQSTIAGVDGDGFVKLTTQSQAFDAADTIAASACNHNFSPLAGDTPGGCQACLANKANAARIAAL